MQSNTELKKIQDSLNNQSSAMGDLVANLNNGIREIQETIEKNHHYDISSANAELNSINQAIDDENLFQSGQKQRRNSKRRKNRTSII
jgi:hypothetical protein